MAFFFNDLFLRFSEFILSLKGFDLVPCCFIAFIKLNFKFLQARQ